MKKILLTISLFSVFLLSCKNGTIQNTEQVSLYSKDGELLSSIKEPEIVSQIKDAIQSSEKTLVKILPIYKYYIKLNIDGEKQSWLISSLGYIKRKDSDSAQLYKIKNAEALTKYLK